MTKLAQVTQADREAAADFFREYSGWPPNRSLAIREGSRDHPLVQAFARHRLAALSEPRADDGELLPCPNPWCGGRETYQGEHSAGVMLCCAKCDLKGPPRPTEADAIAAWNTRLSNGERDRVVEECAVRARAKVIWVLKGIEGRERVADRVAEAISSLKSGGGR